MAYNRIAYDKNSACSLLPNFFYFALWSWLAGKSSQTFEKCSILSIFRHLGPLPQVFGQVKEWLVIELHEVIGVPHVVLCAVDFNLLCDWGQQGGMLRPVKNDDFKVFLAF